MDSAVFWGIAPRSPLKVKQPSSEEPNSGGGGEAGKHREAGSSFGFLFNLGDRDGMLLPNDD
jgi:hypothetical protein